MKLYARIFLALGLPVSLSALADDASKLTGRQPVPNMRAYYDADTLVNSGDTFKFVLYRSSKAGASDEIAGYTIACGSREVTMTTGGKAAPAYRILPGEELYPFCKELCKWDPKNDGLLKKFFD